MHQWLHKMLDEHTLDISFMFFLQRKQTLLMFKGSLRVNKLRDGNFMNQAPTSVFLKQSKQLIYELWLVKNVVSTDFQN